MGLFISDAKQATRRSFIVDSPVYVWTVCCNDMITIQLQWKKEIFPRKNEEHNIPRIEWWKRWRHRWEDCQSSSRTIQSGNQSPSRRRRRSRRRSGTMHSGMETLIDGTSILSILLGRFISKSRLESDCGWFSSVHTMCDYDRTW